jgi:hypothetical protein
VTGLPILPGSGSERLVESQSSHRTLGDGNAWTPTGMPCSWEGLDCEPGVETDE